MVPAVDRRRFRVLRPSDHRRPLRHRGRRGRANHGHDPYGRDFRRKLGALRSAQTVRGRSTRDLWDSASDHEGLLADRGRRRRPQQWRHDPHGRDGAGHGVARSWELFTPWRGSQFGTGSTYGILIWGGNGSDEADARGWMVARGGGGDPDSYALWLVEEGEYPDELSWTLLKQSDGTYALQTSNGTVLSAVGGGAPGVGDSARIPLSTPSAMRRSSPSRTRATSPSASRHSTARTSRGAKGSRWPVLHQSRPQVPASGV